MHKDIARIHGVPPTGINLVRGLSATKAISMYAIHAKNGSYTTEIALTDEIAVKLRDDLIAALPPIKPEVLVLLRNAVEQEYGRSDHGDVIANYIACMSAIDAIAGEKKT